MRMKVGTSTIIKMITHVTVILIDYYFDRSSYLDL